MGILAGVFSVMSPMLVVNIVGWLGSAAVILAYALVSTNRVNGNSLFYQLLNLVGSLFLIINTLYLGALPSAFVNSMWVAIAGYAIWRSVRR
jgi:hypothetical protein